MTSESLIEQLLDKWEEQRNAGLTTDLTEICRDHPQLLQTVTERVRAFEAMDKALRHSDHTAYKISDGQSTPGTTVNSSSPEIMVARAQYRILRSHARGGLGEVLLAQDERLLRQVAIKRIQPHHAGESGRQQRSLREATITGQLDHPGIVSILNVCEDEAGNPCYAMKFVDGQSLDQFARQLHEPFTARLRRDSRSRQLFESHVIRPLLARFVSVCNTIAFAHTRGVIHRDIKPANVMLGDFGATYVVDWGLAKTDAAKTKPTGFEPLIAAENQQTITVADSVTADGAAELLRESLTQTGAVMGTPAFMSPEQASSDTSQVGPLSDIYSLGATLYFLLTGSPPIVSGTDMNWFEQLRTGSFPPPKRVQPFVPTALESVCLKAMSLKPDERYLSPLELARDIDRWLADEPVFAHSDGWSTRIARFTRQHRALTQVGGFALIAITVLSTVLAIVMDDRRRSVEAEVSTSRNLALLRERTAIEMTALAEKESAARRIADEQNNLALSTLRSVIFRIARNLKSVEGAAAIRTQLLTTAIDGLGKVAATLDTRIEVDRNLIVAHNDIGKIYMAAGSLEKVNTKAEALRHFQKAAAIGNTLLNSTPADDMLQRDISVTMELAGDACIQLGDLAAADTLYFSANDGVTGDELWKSDGTAAGTVLVGHSGTASNFTPRNLTSVGGTLYFSAFTFENGTELWKSDGMTAGTNVYRDINPGASPSNVAQLTVVNGTLYYTANDGVKGNELWRHDLTTNTAVVNDIFRGTVNSSPRSFVQAGSNVFFLADNGINGEELWKCAPNGTGATLVKDIRTGIGGSQISNMTNINGTLYFSALTDENGTELWKSDGTVVGTVLVKDIITDTGSSYPSGLTNLNGTLLFSAEDANGHELWKSDGTTAGTVMVKNIAAGAASSIDRHTSSIISIGNTAYFVADNAVNGAELWKTDGTTTGTVMLKDIRTATTGSTPAFLTDVGGRLYFTADDGVAGRELWQSDGTAVGTTLAKDTNPGPVGAVFSNLVNAGGKLFFEAYTSTAGSVDLFCRATPSSETVNLQMFNTTGSKRYVEAPLTSVGTTVYFAQLDNHTGTELWKSDGTLVGTVMVKDIAPTKTANAGSWVWGSNPLHLINNNGTLFFTANNMVNGQELWMSDGTTAGTTLFHDFTGDAGSSHPENLTAINGRIFGSVMSETTGREAISVIDVFTPTAPTISSPPAVTPLQRPVISWTTSVGAVSYDVFIKNNATGANPQVSVNVVGATSYLPTADLGIGKFTVWVRAASAGGTKSAWSVARDFTVNTFVTSAPMIRNQLTSKPEIVWKDLPGAVKYDVYLSSTTTGQVSSVILHDVKGKSWQNATDLALGSYQVWVRGLDASGLAAAWSPVINFNVATAPTLISPVISTFEQRPQFTWTTVPSATKYDAWLQNLDTEVVVYSQQNISSTNWTPPADLPEGHYRWRVLAASANYRGQWANPVDFTIGGRPELLAPLGSTNDTTPTFSWKPVAGAASYQVWVDRTDTYVRAIINISGVTETSYTRISALPLGTFRVWVRAISATGALSNWSQSLMFQITT